VTSSDLEAIAHHYRAALRALGIRPREDKPSKYVTTTLAVRLRRCVMDERDFEGTLVLEQLAQIGRVEDFFDAIDSDDVQRAASLMKKANIDASTIAMVIKKIEDGDGEH